MKFLFNINDEKTMFKADYGQLLNYFKNTPKNEIAESFKYNVEKAAYCMRDEQSFKGGVFADIFKDVVIDTKQQLDAKPAQNFVNKRKRFLSEHDGDYVHERRFDINFMESARREKVAGNNLIKINACGAFSARVSADKIDAYAKEICEIVNYFEAQDRNVELNLLYKSDDVFQNGKSGKMNAFITVKQPDKYISKADIYRAFSTIFFRNIGFCVITLFADANGKQVSTNLGYPIVEENKITVTDSEITIHGMTFDLVNKIKSENKKAG